MSADTVSSQYPDRPIRPLPKRRLRERLSPEVAGLIQYPPTPQTTTPLFYYPYNIRDDEVEPGRNCVRDRNLELDTRQLRRNGPGAESDEEEPGNRRVVLTRPTLDLAACATRPAPKVENGKNTNHLPSLSAASSVDGYECFENTNNKKKRKIPVAGDTTMNGSHNVNDGSPGLASAGKSSKDPGDATSSSTGQYYSPSNTSSGAHNVPGPGRGRYGRVRNGRSPLRALSDSTNNYAGRNGKLRLGQWAPTPRENTGIISSAIANAEKHTPQPGQENISLLHQQQAAKATPASTQFTFTCDSQVPGSLAWPGSDRRSTMASQNSAPKQGENWQERPSAATSQSPPAQGQVPEGGGTQGGGGAARPGNTSQQDQAAARKQQERRDRKKLREQARERERETQLRNRLNPPKPEDLWICELCEYQAIFGERPKYYTEKYERQVLQERRIKEERRRNLAKRMQTPRKSAKKSRAAHKNDNAVHNSPPADNESMHANASNGTQSEDLYDEEYDEDADYEDQDLGSDGEDDLPPLVPEEGGGGGGGGGSWTGDGGQGERNRV